MVRNGSVNRPSVGRSFGLSRGTAMVHIFKRPPAGAAAQRFSAIFIKIGFFENWSKSGFGLVLS